MSNLPVLLDVPDRWRTLVVFKGAGFPILTSYSRSLRKRAAIHASAAL